MDINFESRSGVTLQLFIKALLFSILLFIVNINAVANNELLAKQDLENRIEFFYTLSEKQLPFEALTAELTSNFVPASNKIAESLAPETAAKAYYLLALAANYQGDDVLSLNYVLLAQQLKPENKSLNIKLILRAANAHYELGQFQKVLSVIGDVSTFVLPKASTLSQSQYQFTVLNYRTIAHAALGQHDLAIQYLSEIEKLLITQRELMNDIDVIELVAQSYHYLGNDSIAIQLYTKALKRRFDTKFFLNIERSYLKLAISYVNQNLLSDAYNLYEQIKKRAQSKQLRIIAAQAELGFAKLLVANKQMADAEGLLLASVDVFEQHQLENLCFKTSLLLAEVYLSRREMEATEKWLSKALTLSSKFPITNENADLYISLSQQAKINNNLAQSIEHFERYLEITKQLQPKNSRLNVSKLLSAKDNSQLVVNMSELNEIKNNFDEKFAKQKETIFGLALSTLLFILLSAVLLLKKRRLATRSKNIERQSDELDSPAETKLSYLSHYKMARKFNYPIAIGYLVIENWQELSFHFNQKVLKEVTRNIAVLLNENIDEFEYVGAINKGEYIVLCPHQPVANLVTKLREISEVIEANFFANLGSFSIKVTFECGEPEAKDIDPYIFLSLLSDKANTEAS